MRGGGGQRRLQGQGVRGPVEPAPTFRPLPDDAGSSRTECFIGRMAGLVFSKLVFSFTGYGLQITLSHITCLKERTRVSGECPEAFFPRSRGHCDPGDTVTQAPAKEPSPLGRADPLRACAAQDVEASRSWGRHLARSGGYLAPRTSDIIPKSPWKNRPCVSRQQ